MYPRATKKNGRFTVCLATACFNCDPFSGTNKYVHAAGVAVLAEGDQPNSRIGKRIARSRAIENLIEESKMKNAH